MNLADGGLVVLSVTMAAVTTVGLGIGARRSRLPDGRASAVSAGAAVAMAAWLALTASLAGAGLLSRFDTAPPRVAFLPLAVLAIMVVLSRTPTFERLLEGVPRAWPIALQSFRLPVELLLWALFQEGRIPERMTFGGWNQDILIGLSAPVVAWAVSRGRMSKMTVAVWNVVGLGLLANIVVIALRSAPGPLDAGWGGVPSTVIAGVPFVWLPSFLVPLAVLGHVTSLRQLRATVSPEPASPRGGRG